MLPHYRSVGTESGGNGMNAADSPADTGLARYRVLLVEDEYYIADDMARALTKLGAEVVGPIPTRDKALEVIASGTRLDAAVLDINLQGQMAYLIVDALQARGIPVVFATGYSENTVPQGYQHIPRWEKPFEPNRLAKALPALIR